MGMYLNPGNTTFEMIYNTDIFVDKSLLIDKTTKIINTANRFICISRPRRFGKSTDANMLVAYYSKGCDSHHMFDELKVSKIQSYEDHLNKHNVIHLDMQKFLSLTHCIDDMILKINNVVIKELKREYAEYCDETHLSEVLNEIYAYTHQSFIFVIDEWDCIFREFKNKKEDQVKYLDYLRLLLKEQPYVELCYMTGILPIKKYGTHSALNMFDEITMVQPTSFSEFMGFSEKEVRELCEKYDIDLIQMKEWYNGYHLKNGISIYSPRSVSASIQSKEFNNYWSQTETFEALKDYIDLNLDGLKDDITAMIAGSQVKVDTTSFQNDMTTFKSKDDVLTLLIHLGYLAFDSIENTVYIPNNEVKGTFITSVKNLTGILLPKYLKIQMIYYKLHGIWIVIELQGIFKIHIMKQVFYSIMMKMLYRIRSI